MIGVALGAFIAGLLVAAGALYFFYTGTPGIETLRQSDFPTALSEYRFIDPLIGTKDGSTDSPRYRSLEHDIALYLEEQRKKGLMNATVSFRDINESSGFVVNPTELYTPASLYKVPVMMAYFKISEFDPTIFTQKITYTGTGDRSSVQQIKSTHQLIAGKTYTVLELLSFMISYSDNNAAELLRQNLITTNNLDAYAAVFSDLGIDLKSLLDYIDSVTAQKYSIFLRALYNSTYLNRTSSEHALELLSESDFKSGLVNGLPAEIAVAHKFGEVRMTDEQGALIGKQLHDCGIVYYPKHPYVLCIMTKGQGESTQFLEGTISSISKTVYTHMRSIYR